MNPEIKTVISDLGGVYFTEGAGLFVKKMGEQLGISESNVREVIDGELGLRYRTGAITPGEFWEQARQYWGVAMPVQQLAPLWLECYKPIPGTVEILEKLARAQYELLFLSDNAADRIEYLETRYHFRSRFKDGVFSHLLTVRKPDPRMYEAALKLSSHPAEQCVYVDDKLKLLAPAKDMGMATIAFVSPPQLEKDLKALGLQF